MRENSLEAIQGRRQNRFKETIRRTRSTKAAMKTTPCRSCGAPMVFVRMPTGALNPINPEPAANGNIRITGEIAGVVQGETMMALDAAQFEGEKYLSHYATCPQRREWRKK